MAAGPDTLLRYIRGLVLRPGADEGSDTALLDRFIRARDEKAFAALLVRHGPLVLHVCQRILGDVQDAEDAFQAAFLVLARKAAALRHPEALPAWLSGVARRVALKAQSAKARRSCEVKPLSLSPSDSRPDALAELSVRELLAILDEEVQRLPEAYRLPLILCCLEGRSLEEAARQLGWTVGSVKGRLERGRARLHQRLVRRGATLSAALAAVEASRGAASAAVVARLTAGTVKSAMAFAARPTAAASGASSPAQALAEEMLRNMGLAKLRIAVALMLATCVVTAGFLTYKAAGPPSTQLPRVDSVPLLTDAETAPAAHPQNQPLATDLLNASIAIHGRVLTPGGTPVAGAKLYVGYTPRPSSLSPSRPATTYAPRATSGVDGRFRFTFSRSELEAKVLDAARPAVIAVAADYGPAWAVIGDAADDVELSLKLVSDLPLRGRILDANGKALASAKLRVEGVESASEEALTRYLRGEPAPRVHWVGPLPGQPAVLTTDNDGRFQATGFGRDRIVWLVVEAPDICHAFLAAVTRPPDSRPNPRNFYRTPLEYTASTGRRIRGVVRDKATGEPLPDVQLIAHSQPHTTTVTDVDGRYELLGCLKSQGYMLRAQPQDGHPFFMTMGAVTDGPGIGPLTLDFELVSGIAVGGRVVDRVTGKPLKAALVEYYPLFPNPNCALLSFGVGAASSAATQPDGSYGLAVLPGPGIVCVTASPHDFYAVAMLDGEELAKVTDGKQPTNLLLSGSKDRFVHHAVSAYGEIGQGVVRVNRYHALTLIKPEPTQESVMLDFEVEPARTLQGAVTGLDGKPLTGAEVAGLIASSDAAEVLEGASFTLLGLNSQRSRDLYFHHKELRLGKFLTIPGDENKPLTVQLVPCGTLIGRMVDKSHKPSPDLHVQLTRLAEGYCLTVARTATDTDGRFRIDGLVPGVKYTFVPSRPLRTDLGELEVNSGQSKDLGELVLEK
jgi:RNA polymerase sigma factor (sigma-70 family)